MTQALQRKCDAFIPTRRILRQFITACEIWTPSWGTFCCRIPTPHDETHRLLLQVPDDGTVRTSMEE